MNNKREWEYLGNSIEQNINNEMMIKGNKKNYYKYKDNEKDFLIENMGKKMILMKKEEIMKMEYIKKIRKKKEKII